MPGIRNSMSTLDRCLLTLPGTLHRRFPITPTSG